MLSQLLWWSRFWENDENCFTISCFETIIVFSDNESTSVNMIYRVDWYVCQRNTKQVFGQ